MQSTYSRRADVLSRGFSGYNTRHALDNLQSVLIDCGAGTGRRGVLFYTLWFGANDAALPGTRQHVPVEEYTSNIKNMVELIRAAHNDDASTQVPPIVLITPPPVFSPKWRSSAKHMAGISRTVPTKRRVNTAWLCKVLEKS